MEPPLEQGVEKAPKHLLRHPVANDGYAQWPCPFPALGDEHAPQRLGHESPLLEVAHQGVQVLLEVGLEHPDTDLVNPRRAAVALDALERRAHHAGGDPSRQ